MHQDSIHMKTTFSALARSVTLSFGLLAASGPGMAQNDGILIYNAQHTSLTQA